MADLITSLGDGQAKVGVDSINSERMAGVA